MAGSDCLTEDLRHDLDETNGVINILERASRELTTIIGWDEAVRKNPLRQRQLSSIGEQLAIPRPAVVDCGDDRTTRSAALIASSYGTREDPYANRRRSFD